MHAAQLHVRDRDGLNLTPALRAAEAAVKEELGYTIALIEKPLFVPDGVTPDGAHTATDDAADAAEDAAAIALVAAQQAPGAAGSSSAHAAAGAGAP